MFLETTFLVKSKHFFTIYSFCSLNDNHFFFFFNSWKGSIYKLLWPNLVVYILLYYSLYFVYIFALDEPGQL